MSKNWKKVSEKYVVKTPWLALRKDGYEASPQVKNQWSKASSATAENEASSTASESRGFLPRHYKIVSGSIDYYYIIERPDYVVIVPQTADKKFMLVEQYRHGVRDTVLNFPMGFIDNREKPKQAALRELAEETGSLTKHIKLIGSFLLAPAFLKTKGYVFLAKNITIDDKVKALQHNELIKSVEIVSARQLENLIKKGRLADVSSVAAYLLAKNSYTKNRLE